MILLNKVVEMEYIITINVNTTYIDANQNSVNIASTTGPVRVQHDDQRTMKMLFDDARNRYMPPGLNLLRCSVLMYYDAQPGFAIFPSADMNIPVQQFMQNKRPSSRHLNRTNFIFILNIAAWQVAALVASAA